MKRAADDRVVVPYVQRLVSEAAANAIFRRVLRDDVVSWADLDDAENRFKALLHARPKNAELQYRIGVVMMHLRIDPRLHFELPPKGVGPMRLQYNVDADLQRLVQLRKGVRKSGILWLEKAAEQNHADAAFRAALYRSDNPTKIRLLSIAAAQKHEMAMELLAQVRASLRPVLLESSVRWAVDARNGCKNKQAIDLIGQVRLRMSPLDHVCWAVRNKKPVDPAICATLARSVMMCAIGASHVLRGRGGPLYGKMHDETYFQHIATPLCAVHHHDSGVHRLLPPWLVRRACDLAVSPIVLQLARLVGGFSKVGYEQLLLKDDEVEGVVQWLRRK